jgi:hypothetical protein
VTDPQGADPGPSDPHHGDADLPSEETEDPRGVYTSPDGAMYVAGNLEMKVLNENGTELTVMIAVLITPQRLKNYNEWAEHVENTVLLKTQIMPNN